MTLSALLTDGETRPVRLGGLRLELGGRPGHAGVVDAAAEGYLRFLAGQILARAGPWEEFLVAWAELQAVANAYMMLGLLTGPGADAVLKPAGEALTGRGMPRSWLDAGPEVMTTGSCVAAAGRGCPGCRGRWR